MEKYKANLNFDDLTPSSLGLLSSHKADSSERKTASKYFTAQILGQRNSNQAHNMTEKSNLKLEELAGESKYMRQSRFRPPESDNGSSLYLSNMQDLITQ